MKFHSCGSSLDIPIFSYFAFPWSSFCFLNDIAEMFPTLDVHDLSEILVGNNWNIEASFEAALALNSSRDLIEEEYIIRDEAIKVQAVEVKDDLPSKSEIYGQIVSSTNPTIVVSLWEVETFGGHLNKGILIDHILW